MSDPLLTLKFKPTGKPTEYTAKLGKYNVRLLRRGHSYAIDLTPRLGADKNIPKTTLSLTATSDTGAMDKAPGVILRWIDRNIDTWNKLRCQAIESMHQNAIENQNEGDHNI